MISPVLVGIFGTLTMSCIAVALWLPAYRRQRSLRRRLEGFVNAGEAQGFAIDLGGRHRSRSTRRTVDERSRWALRQIARMIVQAQVDVSVGEVAGAMAVLGLLSFMLAFVWSSSIAIAAAVGVLLSTAPLWWLAWQRRRVERKFTHQLLDMLAILGSSVRAGHSLLQALEHVIGEAPEPTRSAIALVVREIGLGASQEDALERLADRLPSDDLELIVSAVNVHHQIGGSLAKVIDAIAETIRERGRIEGDIKSLTAQQRYSAYILTLLPIAAAAGLYLISPDYLAPLFAEGPLRGALIASAAMVATGFLVMKRMANIDV
ncbi:MAG: type II secretion system F family protein [Candidatus Limnocylindria bacterium]